MTKFMDLLCPEKRRFGNDGHGGRGRVKTAGTSGRDGTTFEYSTRPSGVGWGGLLNEF